MMTPTLLSCAELITTWGVLTFPDVNISSIVNTHKETVACSLQGYSKQYYPVAD